MKNTKLIIHWDAGVGATNETNKEHYHFLVDRNANIYQGNYTIADNENCKDGDYAQHTGGMNTNNIGFSFLGMHGYVAGTTKTKFPINARQLETGLKKCAELCKQYNIPIDDDHVITHYEVGEKVKKGIIPRTQLTEANIGKIDFIWLPCYPKLKPSEIGSFLRNKIQWYLERV